MLAGEESAFNAFFDSYFPRVYRFALSRLGKDTEATQEIAQTSLIKAVNNLSQYRGDASLLTWVCQICRHQIVDYLRLHQHRRNVISIDSNPDARAAFEAMAAPADDEPSRRYGNEETRQLIRNILDRLPERYGDVLEMKYIEDYSVEQIAAALGLGYTATQSILARARVAFRRALETVLGATAQDVLNQLRDSSDSEH